MNFIIYSLEKVFQIIKLENPKWLADREGGKRRPFAIYKIYQSTQYTYVITKTIPYGILKSCNNEAEKLREAFFFLSRKKKIMEK